MQAPPLFSLRTFLSPSKETWYPSGTHSPFSPPSSPGNHQSDLTSLHIRLLWTLHISGIIKHVTFYVWLLPFSIIFGRSIHIISCVSTSFLFMVEWYSIGRTDYILLMQPLIDIWVVSPFWPLWRVLTLIFACLHILCKWSHYSMCSFGCGFCWTSTLWSWLCHVGENSCSLSSSALCWQRALASSALCGSGMGVLAGRLGSLRRSRWEILPGAPQSSLADDGSGVRWKKRVETSHWTGCRPSPSPQLPPTEGPALPRSLGLFPDSTERRPLCKDPNSSFFLLIIQLWSPSVSYLVLQLIACKHSGKRLRPPDFSY